MKKLECGESPADLRKLLADIEERLGPAASSGAEAAGRELAERERCDREVEALKLAILRSTDPSATGQDLGAAQAAQAQLARRAAALPRRPFLVGADVVPTAALSKARTLPAPDPREVAALRETMLQKGGTPEGEAARQRLNELGEAALTRKRAGL